MPHLNNQLSMILLTTVVHIKANHTLLFQHNDSNRLAKSLFEKVLYPKAKTQSTVNHHTTGLHNSFGVSGNVGIGFHFGGGYRIKNGDGNGEQQIVYNKMYDKYLGTSFGFGSSGNIDKGHVNNVEQSNSADQQAVYDDENNSANQEPNNDTIPVTVDRPKPGVIRKISNYWSGEHSEPKSDYAGNGIFKWSVQKFKHKNNVGTPR